MALDYALATVHLARLRFRASAGTPGRQGAWCRRDRTAPCAVSRSPVADPCHSCMSAITGCGVCGSNSVLCAPASPATLRAYSMTASCMPRQMPRYGIVVLARDNGSPRIFPSTPRFPKPPGTRIASISFEARRTLAFDTFRIDVVDIDLRLGLDPGVHQCFGERLV